MKHISLMLNYLFLNVFYFAFIVFPHQRDASLSSKLPFSCLFFRFFLLVSCIFRISSDLAAVWWGGKTSLGGWGRLSLIRFNISEYTSSRRAYMLVNESQSIFIEESSHLSPSAMFFPVIKLDAVKLLSGRSTSTVNFVMSFILEGTITWKRIESSSKSQIRTSSGRSMWRVPGAPRWCPRSTRSRRRPAASSSATEPPCPDEQMLV